MLTRLIKVWRFIRSIKPETVLDRILAFMDGKGEDLPRLLEASPDAKPRQPFSVALPDGMRPALATTSLRQRAKLLRTMPFLMFRMVRGGRFYSDPIASKPRDASPELFEEIEALARSMGAVDVAYVRDIQPDEVFEGKSLPVRHAIIFSVEMDRDELAGAPSFEAFHEVAKGYKRMAYIADALSELLTRHGHAAFPGTSLGGLTDYVALAERAKMGAIGYHGLLIAPDAGARVRLNTVYTDIENLPEREEDPHAWVRDFCAQCNRCIRSCPPQAIYPEPRQQVGARKTCIDIEPCKEYFSVNFGCAICLVECPFSQVGYEAIARGFKAKQNPAPPREHTASEVALRVAVVGAGPAGFYATQALVERSPGASIDLIERLPTPHGLVRYGVAPDHPEVKSKGRVFDRILREEGVRLLGNVTLGEDVTRAELRAHYDAVIYTVGASDDRDLGIPGESLVGSHSATDFVSWYNAHPDHAKADFGLEQCSTVAIIGMGNVALDVARMLSKDHAELARTDIALHALEALATSRVREIHIIGRRGPSQAKFTPKELREVAELSGVTFVIDEQDLERDHAPDPENHDPSELARAARNVELFQLLAASFEPSAPVKIHLHFFARPVEILASDRGRVGAVRLERTTLDLDEEQGRVRATPTGEHFELECELMLRSIGYRTREIAGVPFDRQRGVLPNDGGRLLGEDGEVLPGEYVSGWARRGANGVIGTNKLDAIEVVERLLDDLEQARFERASHPDVASFDALLDAKGVRRVDAAQWDKLRREEHHLGSRHPGPKRALKFTTVEQMLDALTTRELPP